MILLKRSRERIRVGIVCMSARGLKKIHYNNRLYIPSKLAVRCIFSFHLCLLPILIFSSSVSVWPMGASLLVPYLIISYYFIYLDSYVHYNTRRCFTVCQSKYRSWNRNEHIAAFLLFPLANTHTHSLSLRFIRSSLFFSIYFCDRVLFPMFCVCQTISVLLNGSLLFFQLIVVSKQLITHFIV